MLNLSRSWNLVMCGLSAASCRDRNIIMVDLETRCKDAFREALSLVRIIHDDSDWEVYEETEGVVFSTRRGERTAQEIVRGQVAVARSSEQVFAFLSNPFKKREFDHVLTTLEVIEDFGDVKCIFYQNCLPWPLDSREAVYSEGVFKEPDGTLYVLAKSIPADEVPVDEGYIRGNIILCGHVIKPVSHTSSFLTSYFYIDPLGSILDSAKVNAGKQQAVAMTKIKQKIESN